MTIKAGNGFIKLDPSGVTVGGSKVRINSGGGPGSGTGANPLLPRLSRGMDKGVDVKSSVSRSPSMAGSRETYSNPAAGRTAAELPEPGPGNRDDRTGQRAAPVENPAV